MDRKMMEMIINQLPLINIDKKGTVFEDVSTPQKLATFLLQAAKQIAKKHGAVGNLVFILTEDRIIQWKTAPYDDTVSKEVSVALIELLLQYFKPLGYALVHEVWFKAVKKEEVEQYKDGDLSDDVEAEEGIAVTAEWKNVQSKPMAMCRFVRRNGEICDFVDSPIAEQNGGRFAKLMKNNE